jgi:hypothetical protein
MHNLGLHVSRLLHEPPAPRSGGSSPQIPPGSPAIQHARRLISPFPGRQISRLSDIIDASRPTLSPTNPSSSTRPTLLTDQARHATASCSPQGEYRAGATVLAAPGQTADSFAWPLIPVACKNARPLFEPHTTAGVIRRGPYSTADTGASVVSASPTRLSQLPTSPFTAQKSGGADHIIMTCSSNDLACIWKFKVSCKRDWAFILDAR